MSKVFVDALSSSKAFTTTESVTLNSSDRLLATTTDFVFGTTDARLLQVLAKGNLEEADGQALVGLVSSRCTAESQSSKGLFKTVVLSPCGSCLVYQTHGGLVRYLDLESNRSSDLFNASASSTLRGSFSTNAKFFATVMTGTSSNQLFVFQRNANEPAKLDNIFAAGCPIDAPCVAVACETNDLNQLLVGVAGGKQFAVLGVRISAQKQVAVDQICEAQNVPMPLAGIGFGPDARLFGMVYANASDTASGQLWDVKSRRKVTDLAAPSANGKPVTRNNSTASETFNVVFSSDGWYLAGGVSNHQVCVWNGRDGALERLCEHGQGSVVSSLRFLHQTVQLVTTCRSGTTNKLQVWSADDGSTSALTSRYQATETDKVVSAVTLMNDDSALELWRVYRAAAQAQVTPKSPCAVLANSIVVAEFDQPTAVQVHVYPLGSTVAARQVVNERNDLKEQVKILASQIQQSASSFGIKDILLIILVIVIGMMLLQFQK